MKKKNAITEIITVEVNGTPENGIIIIDHFNRAHPRRTIYYKNLHEEDAFPYTEDLDKIKKARAEEILRGLIKKHQDRDS